MVNPQSNLHLFPLLREYTLNDYFFSNSIRIYILFCEETFNSLSVSQIHYEFTFFSRIHFQFTLNSLRIHYLCFCNLKLNSLCAWRIHYKFNTFSRIHYLFWKSTWTSLSFSRIHFEFLIFFANTY